MKTKQTTPPKPNETHKKYWEYLHGWEEKHTPWTECGLWRELKQIMDTPEGHVWA